jgi:hypothetical protein
MYAFSGAARLLWVTAINYVPIRKKREKDDLLPLFSQIDIKYSCKSARYGKLQQVLHSSYSVFIVRVLAHFAQVFHIDQGIILVYYEDGTHV